MSRCMFRRALTKHLRAEYVEVNVSPVATCVVLNCNCIVTQYHVSHLWHHCHKNCYRHVLPK